MRYNESGLFCDLYELTMLQGYLEYDNNPQVVFDMFFRRQPYQGGFSVFAGLEELIDRLAAVRFTDGEIAYLDSLGLFRRSFLEKLAEFRFTGDVYAMPEGSVVFPWEPLIRVHGSLAQAQLVEGLILNSINFPTLIATKSARVYLASNQGRVLEFGLRRAQGPDGALSASRAAYIGGATATSNTLAGMQYGIPVRGTMAHSWVMAFDSELEAFAKYADLYPGGTIILIDTYSTLGSGIENAITVGKRLQAEGKPFGVRLDSGDLQYLSKQVRRKLDEAGLTDATITASNDLTEEIIHQLVTSGSPIDSWGVGTQMATGGTESALSGVYKLAAKADGEKTVPTIKVSNHPSKMTNPGVKQVYRFFDSYGSPIADLIALGDEAVETGRPHRFFHPDLNARRFELHHYDRIEPMLQPVMVGGRRAQPAPPLEQIRERCISSLATFDETYKRIINPHVYKVSLSESLANTKRDLLEQHTTAI